MNINTTLNFPFQVIEPMSAEEAISFFSALLAQVNDLGENNVWMCPIDGQSFPNCLAMALCELSALVDTRTKWSGRCKVEDRLLDRYSRLTVSSGYVFSFEHDPDTRARHPDGGCQVWSVAIHDNPYNPDALQRSVGHLKLMLTTENGVYELMTLISALHILAEKTAVAV